MGVRTPGTTVNWGVNHSTSLEPVLGAGGCRECYIGKFVKQAAGLTITKHRSQPRLRAPWERQTQGRALAAGV